MLPPTSQWPALLSLLEGGYVHRETTNGSRTCNATLLSPAVLHPANKRNATQEAPQYFASQLLPPQCDASQAHAIRTLARAQWCG